MMRRPPLLGNLPQVAGIYPKPNNYFNGVRLSQGKFFPSSMKLWTGSNLPVKPRIAFKQPIDYGVALRTFDYGWRSEK